MTKSEFAEYLRKQGYTVCFEEGVVMALNTSFEKIRREAKKAGYFASYGVRHTNAKQG